MNRITVAALGPGSRDDLTLGVLSALRSAKRVILRTGENDAARYLSEEGIAFETLDPLYDQAEDFDGLIALCVSRLAEAAEQGPVLYAVPDPARDETVKALRNKGLIAGEMPGVPLSAPYLAAAGFPDARRCAAFDLPDALGDEPLLIEELDDRLLAGEVKLRLLPVFGERQPVLFFPPEKEHGPGPCKSIPLEDLDRQPAYGAYAAALIVPRGLKDKERYTVQDLVKVMDILRGENGCPWDRAQDHHTLRPYLIEEAYETAAAIDEEDWDHVAEELGDVLLQVVFQANIGRQYGTMDLSDISTAICRKMIERHPHIFAGTRADTPEAVTETWEELKRKKRGFSTAGEAMRDVSRGLPPLMRAEKVQQKAATARFDFPDVQAALDKAAEEIGEVRQAVQNGGDIAGEIGDLLFACVSAARLTGVEAETALMGATEKFIDRFCRMETLIKNDKKDQKSLTLQEMAVYWNSSKRA